jgi:magnesium transporter
VTVDDIIDAMIEESAEDVQKFGGVEALDAPYMEIGFLEMIRKRAGWLCARRSHPVHPAYHEFGRQLRFAGDLADYPRRGPPGGTLARLWRVALRELPTGVMLGSILGVIGMIRMALWQNLGIFDYGEHWILVACTVGAALVGIVTFGSLAGSMLPFILKRMGSIPRARRRPSWRRSSMSRGS